MDNDALVRAVVEYFTGFDFKICDNPILNGADHTLNDEGPKKSKTSLIKATFISARMTRDDDSADMEITFAAEGAKFMIIYPRAYLTPARDVGDDQEFDIEHLVAENIVYQVDEIIGYHTAQELHGRSISEFWG